MKQKNKEKRLERRRQAYDRITRAKHDQHRPGSMKK